MSEVFSAVKALIKDGDKFLMVKQVQPKGDQVIWDLPGGRISYGESPYEALIRETKEEIGFEVKVIKPIGLWWFFRFLTDNKQVVCNTFLCEVKERREIDMSKNPEVAEEIISEYKWLTKEEFLNGDYPVSHESLKDLIKNL